MAQVQRKTAQRDWPFQVTPLLVAAARKSAERRTVRDVTRLRDSVASARSPFAKAPGGKPSFAEASERRPDPGPQIPVLNFPKVSRHDRHCRDRHRPRDGAGSNT